MLGAPRIISFARAAREPAHKTLLALCWTPLI
jgi:hypothetical protein